MAMVVPITRGLRWVSDELQPPAAPGLTAPEKAWQTWLNDPSQTQPTTPLSSESSLFPAYLRKLLEAQHNEAAKRDPSLHRNYGLL